MATGAAERYSLHCRCTVGILSPMSIARRTPTKSFTLPDVINDGIDHLAALDAERAGAGREPNRSAVIARLVLAELRREEKRAEKKDS